MQATPHDNASATPHDNEYLQVCFLILFPTKLHINEKIKGITFDAEIRIIKIYVTATRFETTTN